MSEAKKELLALLQLRRELDYTSPELLSDAVRAHITVDIRRAMQAVLAEKRPS
jgi:hypothetical protein